MTTASDYTAADARRDALAAGMPSGVADRIAAAVANPGKFTTADVRKFGATSRAPARVVFAVAPTAAPRDVTEDEAAALLRAAGVKRPGALAASLSLAGWSESEACRQIRAHAGSSPFQLTDATARALQQTASAAALANVWRTIKAKQ